MIALCETAPPGELEILLPWRATGRLSQRETHRTDLLLAKDAALSRTYDNIRRERSAFTAMTEQLGVPSPRALLALFSAIDAETKSRGKSS